ncbi:hypothetical protein [Streptomyces acidicola]|uniref:hypothetical protein n=1 Tax=Streptomyces acidicola TaxID=2596892 RepID=UPI00381F72AF
MPSNILSPDKSNALCPARRAQVVPTPNEIRGPAQRVLLPEFDGVRDAGKLPSVGAFADVRHDDAVDEVVLELVVGELARQPEFLDFVPAAPAAVDTQRCGPPVAALAFVVARLDGAADLELAPLLRLEPSMARPA